MTPAAPLSPLDIAADLLSESILLSVMPQQAGDMLRQKFWEVEGLNEFMAYGDYLKELKSLAIKSSATTEAFHCQNHLLSWDSRKYY